MGGIFMWLVFFGLMVLSTKEFVVRIWLVGSPHLLQAVLRGFLHPRMAGKAFLLCH